MKTTLDSDNKLVEALIKSAKNGDFIALKKLYEFVSGRVYFLAKQICANETTAVRQSEAIILTLWEKIKFGKDSSNFLQWLTNNSIDMLLKAYLSQFTSTPAVNAPAINKYLQLNERVIQLPFNERLIVALFFNAGKPLYKISELVELPAESLINLFNSALNILLPTDEECSFINSYAYKIGSNELTPEENTIVTEYLGEHPNCEIQIKELKEIFESLSSLPVSTEIPVALRNFVSGVLEEIQEDEFKTFKETEKLQQEEQSGLVGGIFSKEKKQKKRKDIVPRTEKIKYKKSKESGIPLTSFYARHKLLSVILPILFLLVIFIIYLLISRNDTWQIETSIGSVTIDGARIPGIGTLENGSILETFTQTKSKMTSKKGSVIYLGEETTVKLAGNDINFIKGNFSISKNSSDLFNIIINNTKIDNGDAELDFLLEGDTSNWSLQAERGEVSIYNNGIKTVVPGTYEIFYRANSLSLPVTTDPRSVLKAYVENNTDVRFDSVIAYSNILDAFTLWNLLPRVNEDTREKVYLRLFNIVPIRQGAKHDDIIKLKEAALTSWYNEIRTAFKKY
ncbi:MAG: hypothetical protein Q8903_13615 [Bacteroidota bacterium]|nr:hypothetical protein [Bacteroidota bacterium]